MDIRKLAHTPLPQLHDAFLEVYSDYVVPMTMDLEGFERMMRERGYSATHSKGAFDRDRLVSFWFVGVSEAHGPQILYGLSVGTVPDWQRRGLAEQIFAEIVKEADRNRFTRVVLECITSNDKAVPAYEKMGFRRARDVVLSRGAFGGFEKDDRFRVNEVSLGEAREMAPGLETWAPTWQNSFGALEAFPENVLCLVARADDGEALGLGCYTCSTGHIRQLAVPESSERKAIAETLIAQAHAHTQTKPDEMRHFVNIDGSDRDILDLLQAHGWQHFLAQYEMVFELK